MIKGLVGVPNPAPNLVANAWFPIEFISDGVEYSSYLTPKCRWSNTAITWTVTFTLPYNLRMNYIRIRGGEADTIFTGACQVSVQDAATEEWKNVGAKTTIINTSGGIRTVDLRTDTPGYYDVKAIKFTTDPTNSGPGNGATELAVFYVK